VTAPKPQAMYFTHSFVLIVNTRVILSARIRRMLPIPTVSSHLLPQARLSSTA